MTFLWEHLKEKGSEGRKGSEGKYQEKERQRLFNAFYEIIMLHRERNCGCDLLWWHQGCSVDCEHCLQGKPLWPLHPSHPYEREREVSQYRVIIIIFIIIIKLKPQKKLEYYNKSTM